MFQAIAYKEWLKVRRVWAILLVLCLAALAGVLLSLQHEIRFSSAIAVWIKTVFMRFRYYESLRYLPLLIGLAIAAAQFVPEALSSRLMLSLHLPVRENTVVLWMLAVGYVGVAVLYLLLGSVVCLIGAVYYPREIVWSALLNVAPWLLAGSAGYFGLAAVLVEPRWIRKGILSLILAGFIDLMLQDADNRAFAPSLPLFLVLTAGLFTTIISTSDRFRRGIQ